MDPQAAAQAAALAQQQAVAAQQAVAVQQTAAAAAAAAAATADPNVAAQQAAAAAAGQAGAVAQYATAAAVQAQGQAGQYTAATTAQPLAGQQIAGTAQGTQQSYVNAQGQTVTYTQPAAAVATGTAAQQTTYAATGQQVAYATNAQGQQVAYTTNAQGQQVAYSQPVTAAAGQVTYATNAQGQQATYTTNAQGQQVQYSATAPAAAATGQQPAYTAQPSTYAAQETATVTATAAQQQAYTAQPTSVPVTPGAPVEVTKLPPSATAAQAQQVLQQICAAVSPLITAQKYDDLVECIVELKKIEAFQSEIGYGNYFPLIVPSLITILRHIPVTMMKHSKQQLLRSSTLSMIHRLPSSEFLRKFLPDVLSVATELLETENEDNALVCLKIIVEKYRSFRPTLPESVQRFMAFVKGMYTDFQQIVQMMNSTDELSRERLKSYLTTQITEKTEAVQAHQKSLTDMEQLYSTRHAEYQKLQSAANKMTNDRKVLDKQLQTNRQAQILASQQGTQVTLQQTQEYARLNTELTNLLKPLNDNISQQQTVHAQLTSYKNRYMESQGGQQRCQQEIKDLQSQQQQLHALEQEALAQPNTAGEKPAVICRGNRSFKVLADCRNIVILLLQLYKDTMQTNVEAFVPLMVKALGTQVVVDDSDPAAVDNHLKYIASQVKTLWFLTFCMNRNYSTVVKPYAPQLSSRVMFLLRSTPPGAVTVRKELLIATRQLLTLEEFRAGFLSELNNLMDQDILLGKGWTAQESLKPLAYSTLADLLHHVRDKLTMSQLSRAIHTFLHNVLDNTLPLQIQTMSCKLLLNLVQILAPKLDTQGVVRNLLLQILDTFIAKLKSVRAVQFERVLQNAKSSGAGAGEAEGASAKGVSNADITAALDAHRALLPIPVHQISMAYIDGVKDCRFLLKTLINGIGGVRGIIQGIQTANLAAKGTAVPGARLLKPEEGVLFHRLLRNGLACFDIYGVLMDDSVRALDNLDTKPSPEEKDTIDSFAKIFAELVASIDPALVRELFESRMPELVDAIVRNNLLQVFPQLILSNKSVSTCFANSLLQYLLSKLDLLGEAKVGQVHLRLFKLVFGSVNLYAEVNEKILQPHLSAIIHKSMSLATTVDNPANYFLLLRALFRSIGGGKFEELYKEFLPLLPALLAGLNRLQECAHRSNVRDLFVELCLTVPVRLSALLPYLHYLMRPLVLALQSGDELISQGLRTLELCIDNLSPEFLAPIIEPVRVELMNALWRHMKPEHTNTKSPEASRGQKHGVLTFRLLGKLGGRNRCVFKHPPTLTPRSHKGAALRVALTFDRTQTVYLAIDNAISVAVTTLKTDPLAEHQRAAYQFLKAALVGLTNLEPMGSATAARSVFPYEAFESMRMHSYFTPETRQGDCRSILVELLEGLFYAATRPALKEESKPFVKSFIAHCTMLSACIVNQDQPKSGKPLVQIDPSTMVEPLFKAMGFEDQDVADVAFECLELIFDTTMTVYGPMNIKIACQNTLFSSIAHQVCASCYNREWYTKRAGCLGIKFLIERMPDEWIMAFQLKFNKALLFAAMDLSDQIGMGVAEDAQDLMLAVITKCFQTNPMELTQQILIGQKPAPTPAANKAAPAAPQNTASGSSVPMEVEAPVTAAQQFRTADTELGKLVKLLATELVCPDDTVRKQVKQALSLVSQFTGKSLYTLLMHTNTRNITLPKTTRNCSINVQVGRMDAIAYCLMLDPPLVALPSANDKESGHRGTNNTNYMREVLEICKLDDVRARNAMRPGSPGNPTALVTLRQRAIELVGAVVLAENWADHREAAVAHFVSALLSEHDVIADAAGKSLLRLQNTVALPKEIMQNTLRPLLGKLADYRALSLPVLRSISRLLGLLPVASFNSKFGEQLFDHWSKWLAIVTRDTGQDPPGEIKWQDSDSIRICTAIIDLLPKLENSERFLAPIVDSVVNLELQVGRYHSSPFRMPLVKFLESSAAQAVELFLGKVDSLDHARLFRDILDMPEANKIHAALKTMAPMLIDVAFKAEPEASPATPTVAAPAIPAYRKFYEGIALVQSVVKRDPEFLVNNPAIMESIKVMWDNPAFYERFANPEVTTFSSVVDPRAFITIQLEYIAATQTGVQDLFRTLKVFEMASLVDSSFMIQFLNTTVAETFPTALKREILLHMIKIVQDGQTSQTLLKDAIYTLCIPIIVKSLARKDTPEVLGMGPEGVVAQWIAALSAETVFTDTLKIAVMQLSVILVRCASKDATILTEFTPLLREQYLEFAWSRCFKGESNWDTSDISVKYSGYVFVCETLAGLEHCPRDTLLEMHSTLVESHSGEQNKLIRKAVNLLQPLLPKYAPPSTTATPEWLNMLCSVVARDNLAQTQVQHVWAIIVRHGDIYYPYRDYLAKWIVQSLGRVLSTVNAQPDTRKLPIEVAEMLIGWEERSNSEAAAAVATATAGGVAAMDTSYDTSAVATCATTATSALTDTAAEPAPTKMTIKMQEAVINFLTLSACSTSDVQGSTMTAAQISARCIELIGKVLVPTMWLKAGINIGRCDKLLQQCKADIPPNHSFRNYINTLNILKLLLERLDRPAALQQVAQLHIGLRTVSLCKQPEIAKTFREILYQMLVIMPCRITSDGKYAATNEVSNLYKLTHNYINKILDQHEREKPETVLHAMQTLAVHYQHNLEYVQPFLLSLSKTTAKYQKDHLHSVAYGSAAKPSTSELQPTATLQDKIRVIEPLVAKYLASCGSDTMVSQVSQSVCRKYGMAPPSNAAARQSWVDAIVQVCVAKGDAAAASGAAAYEKAIAAILVDVDKAVVTVTADCEKCLGLCIKLTLPSMFESDSTIRKPYLSIIHSVAEKSNSPSLIESICSLSGRVLMNLKERGQHTMVLREKVGLFSKIATSFIKRFPKHALIETAYTTVLSIFKSSDLAIADLVLRLEGIFMLGLAADNASIREEFFQLFNSPNQDSSLHGTLDYCFSDRYQRWESSEHTFWMKHCVDVILAGALGNRPIRHGPGVIRLPPLIPPMDTSAQGQAQRAFATPPIPERFKDVVKGAVHLVTKLHEPFLNSMRQTTISDIIDPLRVLCFISPDLANQIWIGVFPLLWHILDARAKEQMSAMLQNLLAQDYHAEQAAVRPNNVQAILTGMSRCAQPTDHERKQGLVLHGPEPTLLFHLAKTHNLWHTAIVMLRLQAANRQPQVADGRIDPIQDAIGDLYTSLGETDTWFGLWRLRAKLSKSAKALAFEQQGYWEKAQEQYEDVMQSAAHHGVRDAEFQLWESHWMLCGQQLGNHELLMKYAEETKNQDLLLKSAWKLKSWKKLKDTLRRVQVQREPSFDLYLSKAYLVIATQDDINMGSIDNICMDATKLALTQWAALPPVVSHSHGPILEAAQRFVELQESADLCTAMVPGNASRQPTQDLANLVEMWRKRLPNEWDDIHVWHELLVWRLYIFEKIGASNSKSTSNVSDQRLTFASNEIAWTVNKLTSIARKHKLKSLCDKNLSMMYKSLQSNPDKNDLFVKAREQVTCNIELLPKDQEDRFKVQLESINSINLQMFTPAQSAELCAYKGRVLHQMGNWEDANKVFSAALALSEDLGVGWECWAIYCDDMFRRVCESIESLRAETNAAKRQKTEAATESNAREWAKSAMTCYLHACRSYDDDEKIKHMIARCLLLLANDDSTGEVGQTFSRLSDLIDTSVWKFWIPQLLTSFSRPEAKYVHNLLVRLAKFNPQALYYSLRTSYLEIRASGSHNKGVQRMAAQKRPAASPSPQAEVPSQANKRARVAGAAQQKADAAAAAAADAAAAAADAAAAAAAKPASPAASAAPPASELMHVSNVMQNLRVKHSMLAGTLENMIEDLVARFKPTPEEEFLRTTHVLLEECLKQALNALDRAHDHWTNRVGFINVPGGGQQSWTETFPKKAPVPRQVATHLKRVLETFFTPTNSPMMKYRARFEADFGNMESGELTLDGCLLRLHEWHRHMSSLISRMPKNHRLEDFSHFLMTFSGGHAEIHLPGEHLVRHSFHQQSHTFIRIERFLSEVKVVHKHSAAFRQVTIRGRDGRLYPYLIQQASTRHARTEERFMHFLRMLNMMLDKRKETRKRSLTYYVPRVVPLNVHVRLVQHPASVLSLEDVFQEFCTSSQTYVDQPTIDSYVARRDQFQMCHKQFDQYTAHTGRGIREFFGELRSNDAKMAKAWTSTSTDIRKEIFDTIRKENVPMDILRRFMLATFPDHTDVWMFQRQFTSQLALSAFASYVLMLVKGAPHTLLFALDTGNIFPWDLNVTFNREGELVAPEPVPFRLTPNLVNFITPVGITGLFSSAMISAAEAIHDTEFKVQNYLGALLRDEMISWHAINREPYAKSAITNTQLVKLVATNTQKISERLEALSNAEGSKLVQTRSDQQRWACKEADTLIKQATGTKNLCNMPPMWHPWL